jgi:integrase
LAKAKAVDPDDPDKAVLTKPIRIHDLRHTAASWLLGAGVPLIVVSAHLGHEDTSVTLGRRWTASSSRRGPRWAAGGPLP